MAEKAPHENEVTVEPSSVQVPPVKEPVALTDFTPEDEDPCSLSVIVKNIPPSTDPNVTTSRALEDFISFCGHITNVSIVPDESDGSSVSAIVTFDKASAAQTALLLNHSRLHERTITVAPYNFTAENLTFESQDLVSRAARKAAEVDEQFQISAKMNEVAKNVEDSVAKIDQDYHISEKLNTVVGQVKDIDAQYQISTKVNQAAETVSDSVKGLDEQYQISTKMNQAAVDASDKVTQVAADASQQINQIDHHYQVTETVVSAVEKVGEEGARLLEEGHATVIKPVTEFFQTNETAKEVVSGVEELGNYISSGLENAYNYLVGAPVDDREASVSVVQETKTH
jgi:hypothetical protein